MHTTILALWSASCAITTHDTTPSQLGRPADGEALIEALSSPGPLKAETIVSADWSVDRAGLIDLEHPKASHLKEGLEPVQIYFHAIRHPKHGLFIIDTGVERAMRDNPSDALITGFLASAMHAELLKVREPRGDWLRAQKEPLRGVFMTHLHLDHVSGMRDVPRDVPIYTGPGEAKASAFLYMFVQGTINKALIGKGALREWRFAADSSGRFEGVVDVFGDGSLFAIWAPGHTPGSTAYLARTVEGPVLFVGDVCHTEWGWRHEIRPGSFTQDPDANTASLNSLIALAKSHPSLTVRLGHQTLRSNVSQPALEKPRVSDTSVVPR